MTRRKKRINAKEKAPMEIRCFSCLFAYYVKACSLPCGLKYSSPKAIIKQCYCFIIAYSCARAMHLRL